MIRREGTKERVSKREGTEPKEHKELVIRRKGEKEHVRWRAETG